MTLDPLLQAPVAVQVHALAAILAACAAPVALLRRARDGWHRAAGRVFVLGMAVAALSSFLIGGMRLVGPFSPIHVLSAVALASLWRAVRAIRRGDAAAHAAEMRGLALYALALPGLLALLPGRRMNLALFPGAPLAGFGLAALAFAGLWILARRGRARGATRGAAGVTAGGKTEAQTGRAKIP